MEDVTRQDGGLALAVRIPGVLACGGAVSLWMVFLFANPHGGGGLTMGSFFVAGAMVVLAAAGAAASIAGEPLWMGAVAAVSLCPVGFYLLGAPSVFLWIGICNLILLVAAAVLHIGRGAVRARPGKMDSTG